uniref:Uncharacterized protein n=1 Tax=Aegilops tauschii TaxID=37682 RepID=M8CKW8_AEGTA
MTTKSLLLAALLVLAVSLAPHGAEAAGKQPPLAMISGVVPCSAGNSINAAAVPPFPTVDELELEAIVVLGRTAMAESGQGGGGGDV